MFLLIVTHEVEDYERFRRVFDAHPPSRGGATSHTIARAIDHPRAVTIIATFTSADRAVAWRDDPELRAALGDAGIVGVPSIAVVEEVERVDHDVP